MRVLKHTLVLMLLVAAGVIFPLRRAQQAFGARPVALGLVGTRKPTFRRRVGGPRFDFKRANPTQSPFATDGPVAVRRVARRRLTFAAATAASQFRAHQNHSASAASTPARFASVAQKAVGAHAASLDCLPPAAADRFPEPRRLNLPTLPPPVACATQAVGDTPVPPPRC
jgi:hypothetical protein